MKIKLFLCLLLLSTFLVGMSHYYREENLTVLNLHFFDEATGIAIVPEVIEIKSVTNAIATRTIQGKEVAKNGYVSVILPYGQYEIIVHADKYKEMQTQLNLKNQSLNVNFNLVPLTPIKEFSLSYIQSLHKNNAMVMVGFVVDNSTGEPLENVVVRSEDNVAKTVTDRNGFYALILPFAENEQALSRRGVLLFEKTSYITESRINFDMGPGSDGILSIRMQKGQGLNTENVIKGREVSRITLDKMVPPAKK